MKSKKEARCVHKERIILLWVVFAAVLLFVLASPNNIFEYQKIDLIQESFATLIGPGNLLTGAVIGVQDFSIQAEFSSQLGDFIEPFSGTSINETRWNYTNDNGASDISWNEALYINLTPNGAGADEQDFRIQDEYLNLSTDFNVTFDANQSQNFPLTGTNYTFITVGIINNSEDGFVGSSCQYIWNATDMAISTNKGFSTQNRTAFVSSTNDNFSIEVSYNPTTLQFNCSGTVSGTRQSTEVDTNIFTTDAKNLTFGFQVGTFDKEGIGQAECNTGECQSNLTIDDINFSTSADDVAAASLVTCGTITTDTTMDQNVTIDNTCFIIGANDITLDCAGYEINYSNAGTFGHAVNITEFNHTTIKNCIIEEGSATTNQKDAIYMNAVDIDNVKNTTVYNNTIHVIGQQSYAINTGDYGVNANVSENTINCDGGCAGVSIPDNDNLIYGNTINLISGFMHEGIHVAGYDNNVTQNTVLVDGTSGGGISAYNGRNLITNNTVTGSGTSVKGLFLNDPAENNTLSENFVNLTGAGSTALAIISDGGDFHSGNIFLNNNLTALSYGMHDQKTGGNNSIIYNNSFGMINWTSENLTTQVNLTMDINVFLENNNIGFQHEDQDGSGEHLNGTSEIEIYGLTAYTDTPQLLKDGVRCDDTNACNISFDAANDILYANISSFSNYTTQANGVSCGTITTDTTMDQDLTNDSTCFNVTGSNFVLNCNGYQINGTAPSSVDAISLNNLENVTIHSCNIFNFNNAISLNNATNNLIYNITETNASLDLLSNSANNSFSNITISQTPDDAIIAQGGASDNNFTNITISNPFDSSNDGVIFISTNNNIFDQITIQHGNVMGIQLNTVTGNIVRNSTFENITVGVRITSTSSNNLIENVQINVSGSNALSINDDSSAANSFIYNNSYGQINWTNITFSTKMNLSVGTTIFLENNNVGVLDDASNMQSLNSSAEIEIYGLTAYTETPQLLRNGVRCDNTNACNISFDATNDILYANISSFSNYTTQDLISPNVTTLLPSVNTVFNVSNVIEIAANVTDGISVSDVTANITFPNGTIQIVTLSNASTHDDKFNVSFTAPALIGLYNLTFIANDTSNNLNASETSNFTVNDTVNPTILDLIPAINSEYNTLQTIEIAVNVTDDVNVSQVFANVSLVNGTITEVELSLDSSNRYNNTYTIPASVNGTYNITFIANDTSGNYNTTNTTNFTAVSIDTDGDGADDAIDTLIGNESDITSQGVAGLNITVGGAQVNGTFTGENEVLFFNDSLLFVNFTHNFSLSGLNLSNFTINFTSTSLVVNFSGQIQRGYNKTLYFPDNSYTSICVEDGEIDSDTDISSTCDGTNEIDFDTCVGVSSGTTISGKTCYDNGTTITIENLSFSGVRGTTTAAAAPAAASAAASSSSGGSSLPPSADVGEAADAGDTGDSSPGSSEPGPSGPTGAAVSPPGPSNLAGKAFFGDFGEFSQQFGRYILTGILAVLALGTFTYGGRKIHHKIKHRHTLIHKPMEQVPNRSLRIVPMTFIDPKEPMDDKIDSINQQLAALQIDEIPEPKKRRLFPKLFQSNTKEVILANELDNLNQEIHGYERTQILDKPKGKQEWDYRLEEIEIALGDVEVKGSKGRIITSTAETKDDYGNTQNAIMGKELERISQTLQGKEKVIPKISKLKKVKNYEDLEDQADDATGYELEEIENELKRLEDM